MIPDDAVEAAMRAWGVSGNDQRRIVGSILEAAAPYMMADCIGCQCHKDAEERNRN